MLYVACRKLSTQGLGFVFYYFFAELVGGVFGFSLFYDLVIRCDQNDPFVGSYYLLWTTLHYIPILVLMLLMQLLYVNLTFSRKEVIIYTLLLLKLLVIYMLCVSDLFVFNNNYKSFIKINIKHNLLLINSLNKYHPYFFYLCATYCFYYSLQLYLTKNRWVFTKNRMLEFTNFSVINYKFLFLCMSFLYLGAWWAGQESEWGGWWNSDISEMLGLLFWVSALIILHWRVTLSRAWLLESIVIIMFILALVLYHTLKIKYTLTAHNFGLRMDAVFNEVDFYRTLLIIASIRVLCKIKRKFYYTRVSGSYNYLTISKSRNKFFATLVFIVGLFLVFWILSSFVTFVVGDEGKQASSVHLLCSKIFKWFLVYTFLLFLTTFFNVQLFYMITSCALWSTYIPFAAYLLLCVNNRFTPIRIIHWCVLGFICINFFSNNCFFFVEKHRSYYSSTFWVNSLYQYTATIYSNEGTYINKNFITVNSNFQLLKSWTCITIYNSADCDLFLLYHTNQFMLSWIYDVLNYEMTLFLIELNEVYLLNLLTLVVMLSFWRYFKTPQFNFY